MNAFRSIRIAALIVLVVAIAAPGSVLAQEEAPAEDTGSRLGNFFVDYGTWVAQPVGLGYSPATVGDPSTPGLESKIVIPHGTADELQVRLEYRLPSNRGAFEYRLYKHEDQSDLSMFSPSDFIYGESLTFPLYAGAFNDYRADAFASTSYTRLREWRLDYRREAFRSPRVNGDWFVGWRRVRHSQELAADYFGLVPNLPVILPPACDTNCPDLDPLPDSAGMRSSYEGRGLTAGVDLEFPLWKSNVVLEGGVAISVLRGTLDASYTASNSYYVEYSNTNTFVRVLCDTPEDCAADYETFDDTFIEGGNTVYQAERIFQRDASFAMGLDDASQNSLVVEAELALRWRTPLKRLEVFGGFRQASYEDVAAELVPTVQPSVPDIEGRVVLTSTGHTLTSRSVTYEGFYGGVTIRLY